MRLPRIASYELPFVAQIPPARAKWALDPNRAALLIHDMQNYFVRAFEQDASPITPVIANIVRLKAAAVTAGMPVFYTAQNGNQDRRDRGLQADLWGPGMTTVPEHQPIIDLLSPAADDIVVVKHRYSAFQMSNLAHLMRVRGRDQIVISGIYAHIGCLMTAGDAFQRDIEPFFIADAMADFSREQHDMALSYVAATCGIPLSVETLIRGLDVRAEA
ncbi:bifunctional isochorismate lyase/aryl carrier protein [Rhodopseudomonas rhenobacensis]|uniref:Bifunctional isochorismate lyase/aryl carrier protein n=1 Tax=Rhodopseudomonas rhenobacensis TaxID=87461 RepID=A0A7W8E252_9BRAD|nr:isochorismatase family protein [Rhodopseudomonas rhenobacensis]MBB5049581.1 bifunctional isochorismate lyase/aryl carrier protein [Rhodopseudomonas rhenobacensis]